MTTNELDSELANKLARASRGYSLKKICAELSPALAENQCPLCKTTDVFSIFRDNGAERWECRHGCGTGNLLQFAQLWLRGGDSELPSPNEAALFLLERVFKRNSSQAASATVELLSNSENILRPAMDFRDDFAVVTVAVQAKVDGRIGWRPVAVTSDRGKQIVDGNAVVLRNQVFVFEHPPLAVYSLARWRLDDIERFCAGEKISPKALFESLREVFAKYIDYPDPSIAECFALWTVGTYVFALFPAFPYIELNAPRGSGKSKQLKLLSLLAFNGRMIGAPTEASTFRLIQGSRGTICFDEAETLDKDQKAALLQILNMGYTAGGTVARCEEKPHAVREFDLYCPKAFASIRGIDSTTATRCVRIQFLRTKDAEKGNRAVTEDAEPWAELRHWLYSFALTEFRNVRKMFSLSDVRPFANRDNELWSPILALAAVFESYGVDGLAARVLKLAKTLVADQAPESGLPPFDVAVLCALHQRTQANTVCDISPKALLDEIRSSTGDDWSTKTPHGVGYALKRLGFKALRRRNGTTYHVSRAQIEDMASRYGVELASENIATNATEVAK